MMLQRIVSLVVMILILSLAVTHPTLAGAKCKVEYHIFNKDRMVVNSNLWQECGGAKDCGHSAPFGNWGVDSKYSTRGNKRQFDGWEPAGSQFHWNTCTSDRTRFPTGDSEWYNFPLGEFTAQLTVPEAGENRIDGEEFMFARWFTVSCPTGEIGPHAGGCAGVSGQQLHTSITMQLYELDADVVPFCGEHPGDDFITSLSFSLWTTLDCDVHGCEGSNWILAGSNEVTARASLVVTGSSLDDTECDVGEHQ